ncbi:MAG: hypothetical protein EOP05_00480 [Proteobacteria bacterium]|nr:MAG: hypothetical protein EOP05_00480 [Pseudomonadota bacterium]
MKECFKNSVLSWLDQAVASAQALQNDRQLENETNADQIEALVKQTEAYSDCILQAKSEAEMDLCKDKKPVGLAD